MKWIKFSWLALVAFPVWFARAPVFTVRVYWRHILHLIFREFKGHTLVTPTGDRLFNRDSLTIWCSIHVLRLLGTSWHQRIRETQAPVVVDVGSNLGHLRSLVLDLNPGANVLCVDANAAFVGYNPSQITTALGAKNGGELTLHRTGWSAGKLFEGGGSFQCPQQTLDSLTEHLDTVHLLKIDVDGYEFEVLRGAKRTLAKTEMVIIETFDEAVLDRLGYTFVLQKLPSGHDWLCVNTELQGVKKPRPQLQELKDENDVCDGCGELTPAVELVSVPNLRNKHARCPSCAEIAYPCSLPRPGG